MCENHPLKCIWRLRRGLMIWPPTAGCSARPLASSNAKPQFCAATKIIKIEKFGSLNSKFSVRVCVGTTRDDGLRWGPTRGQILYTDLVGVYGSPHTLPGAWARPKFTLVFGFSASLGFFSFFPVFCWFFAVFLSVSFFLFCFLFMYLFFIVLFFCSKII
jgi:hypothetical protein